MGTASVQINGIDVVREFDHYLLRKDNVEMRCDVGELNECISEFIEYLREKSIQRLQTA